MDTPVKITVAINQEGSRGYMWHLRQTDKRFKSGDIYRSEEILNSGNLYLTVGHAEDAGKAVIERLNSEQIQVIDAQDPPEDIDDDGTPIDTEGNSILDQPDPWNHNGKYEYIPNSFLVANSDGGYGYYGMLILDEPIIPSAFTYYAETKQEIRDRIEILLKGNLEYHDTVID